MKSDLKMVNDKSYNFIEKLSRRLEGECTLDRELKNISTILTVKLRAKRPLDEHGRRKKTQL